ADDTNLRNYGDSVVKLKPNLSVAGSSTPTNQFDQQVADLDLGSGGVMVLPDNPPRRQNLVIACGKEGTIYVLDHQQIDRKQHMKFVFPSPVGAISGGVYGGPAYFKDQSGREIIYYCGSGTALPAFTLAKDGKIALFDSTSKVFSAGLGAIPFVSSNGGLDAIVWVIERTRPIVLHAYDALHLSTELFSGPAGPWNNPHGAPFLVPTVINGKVFVGSEGLLTVFGPPAAFSLSLKFGNSGRIPQGQDGQGTLTLNGPSRGIEVDLFATDSTGNDVGVNPDSVILSASRPTANITVLTRGLTAGSRGQVGGRVRIQASTLWEIGASGIVSIVGTQGPRTDKAFADPRTGRREPSYTAKRAVHEVHQSGTQRLR